MAQKSVRSVPKHLLLLLLVLFICIPLNAQDDDQLIFLNNLVADDGSISIAVIQGENSYLPFTATTESRENTVEIYLTSFLGEQGDNIIVKPNIVELPDMKLENQQLSILLNKPVFTLKLEVPDLPTAGKYTGSLVVQRENQIMQLHTIVLTRAKVQRLAILSVDPKEISTFCTKSFFGFFGEPASFTVLIRNNNPDWQAKGVFLRLLEVTSPKGTNFNPKENLELKWNGKEVDDFWRSPQLNNDGISPRFIPSNQQAELSGELLDLTPGEYTIKLSLAAANGLPESEGQILLKIQVRHNITWALLILLIAIIVSFIANKFLETQYSRAALLRRIENIRPPWLREETNTLPVVSVRTILKQAEDRNKNIFTALFSSAEVVNERIDKAEKILIILSRIRNIREKIRNWNIDKMIKYRAEKKLGKIISEMGWELGNEKFVKELEIKLELLENWFIPDQLYSFYWLELKEDIENLLPQAKPGEFSTKKHQNIIQMIHKKIIEKVNQLNTEIKETAVKQRIIINLGHDYAVLKILWESRVNGDSNMEIQLFEMFKGKKGDKWPAIKEFWAKADEIAWNNLKAACEIKENKAIEFTSPLINNIQALETFQLIQFKISTCPPSLSNNYLFHHGLDYQWTLFKDNQDKKEILTKPLTKGPQLVQYIPDVGKYRVSVQMFQNGLPAKEILMEDEIEIKSSEDFGWKGIFQSAEITALSIAVLFAFISGLSSFYFSNPIFGNVKDYITLFIWGAGVDLGKNFIQRLQKSSRDTDATS